MHPGRLARYSGAQVKGSDRAGAQPQRRRDRKSTFRHAARLTTLPVVLLTVFLVVGCTALPGTVVSVTVSHPVWMSDGWVYYLREVSSDGAELWRQRDSQDAGKRVLGMEDVRGICDRAQLSFLFRAADDEVGIAAECAGGSRTELTAYSPERRSLSPIASTPFLGGVALASGKATGYVELPTACGSAIEPIRDGVVREFASPITVAGRSWKLSGAGSSDCGSVAWARSPALGPDGSLYFLAAPDSIGRLPVTDPDALDKFQWYLCSWDGRSAAPRVVTTLRGVADLTVSADGRVVVAALSTPGVGGILIVDTDTGRKEQTVKERRAYHASVSPDGHEYVYVEDLRHLRFGSLPT
jgi:hypothetical protein